MATHPSLGSGGLAFTRTRVVALALIALVALGLGYLRLTSGPDTVTVPTGAQAGDLVTEPCTYPTEDGAVAAECGTLVVPENHAQPGSRLIALPVVRIPARSDDPGEPIFWLQGGPGQSNQEVAYAARYIDSHDFVLVGYRGVDGSVRLDCPEVESALKRSADHLSPEAQRAYAGAYRECANRFSADGVDLTQYGLVQQVDDMEAARVALGYDQINLLSESAGTRTAMIYAWRYPASVHRSVMVAVNPPGNYLWDPATTNELIGRYGDLCAEDDACRGRTDDLVATLRETTVPDRWWFLPIKDANVRIVAMFGLMETTANAEPASGPNMIDTWLSAAEGDPSGMWFGSVFGDLLFPNLFVRGQYAAAASADFQAARDYFSAHGSARESNIAYAATFFGWGGGLMTDSWPEAAEVDKYSAVRRSDVETLIVNGELDFATPPEKATEQLLPYLPNGHEVVLPEFGHVLTFFTEQPEAGTHLITAFFNTGRVDDSLYRPQPVDFTPSTTTPGVAKLLLGVMLGLAALTVLSLAAMWARTRRAPFGRVSVALLRTLHPVVLGLGGLSLGVLVVWATMQGVTIDNELLTVLSVGVPVALGVYFACLRPDRLATAVGLAVTTGSAALGAWLGFHATAGIETVAPTILGGLAGANLAVICLDMGREAADHPEDMGEVATRSNTQLSGVRH